MVALLVFTIKLSVVNANAFLVFQFLKKLGDSVLVLTREQVSEFGGFFHRVCTGGNCGERYLEIHSGGCV